MTTKQTVKEETATAINMLRQNLVDMLTGDDQVDEFMETLDATLEGMTPELERLVGQRLTLNRIVESLASDGDDEAVAAIVDLWLEVDRLANTALTQFIEITELEAELGALEEANDALFGFVDGGEDEVDGDMPLPTGPETGLLQNLLSRFRGQR